MNQNLSEDHPYNKYAPRIISELDFKETSKGWHHGSCLNCGDKTGLGSTSMKANSCIHRRQCDDLKPIKDNLRDRSLLPRWERYTSPQNKAA